MAGLGARFDADFGKFVSELGRVDVKLREFDASADKSSARLERMANALNGNKILEQAAVAVNAINRIEGGVAALNKGELKRYGTLIDAATEKLVRQGREVPPALAQVKAALDAQRAALEGTAKAASETSGVLSGIGGAIGQGLGIGAGLGVFDLVTTGVGKLKDEIVETIAEGNKLSQLRSAFEQLQGGPGPATVALEDLRAATRGLVTDLDLMQAANKASLLGLGEMGIKTDELASVAVRLGKAMGQDAAKSVDDLTTALARQSPQILDNLGIKVNLTDANEKYAASHGKVVSALTEEEKKLAFATAAMDAARAKAETLGEQNLTLTEQITRVSNALDNAQAGFGAAINESGLLSGAVGLLAESFEDLITNAGQVKTELADVFGPAGQVAGSLLALASNSELAGEGLKLALLPGLTLVNAALKGTAAQLDRVAALRELTAGTLTDVQLPSIARDRTLLDPTAGQGKRAQDWLATEQKRLTDEYIKAQDDALKKLESGAEKGNAKLDQLAKARTERLNRLTGRDALLVAQQTVKDLAAVGGVDALSKASVSKTFAQLFEAREIAKGIAPNLVAGLDDALGQLAKSPVIQAEARAAGEKIFRTLLDPNDLRKVLATSGTSTIIGRDLAQALSPLPDLLKPTIADTYELAKNLRGVGVPLEVINERFEKVNKTTGNWRVSVLGVGQAFANLSQITGGLDPVTRQIGTIISALDTAEQVVTSVGKAFDKSFDFGKSKTGQNAATAIAAGIGGLQLGMQSGLSPWRAAGVGALTGGAAGIPAAAATGGASVAIGVVVGATTAYFGAQKAASELRKAKDLQAQTLVAQYGTLDALLETVGALGLSQQTFLERYYGEPQEFAKGVTDLNNALTREKREAEELAKSLDKVAKAQGVLSFGDRARLQNPREGGPLDEVAEQFRTQQTGSLMEGLQKILAAPGALSKSLVTAVGQSLPAALAALEQGGASPIEALKTLMPLLDQFREKAVLAGAGSTPGFDALNRQLEILKDERLGPLIERANGAGQALGALNNLDLLDDETFGAFAASITESVAGIDLLSERGQDAMRLIRQPLQNVWQLQKDFGYEVDASTQALLDQAEAAGLIGDKFRPTEEKILLGIDKMVDRLDTLIDGFTNGFPQAAITGADKAVDGLEERLGREDLWHKLRDGLETEAEIGAGIAADAIEDTFARLRIRVPIHYEGDPNEPRITYPEDPRRNQPPVTLPLPSAPEQSTSSAGVAAAQAATATSRGPLGVYIDGRLAGEAILPHVGGILEFNGVERVNA